MKKLKGALIGCGFFAENHILAWKELTNIEIICVCDLDIKKANKFKSKFNILYSYSSIELMLKKHKIDFVDVVTTMETHLNIGKILSKYKIPTSMQKPFAENLSNAKKIVSLYKKNKTPLMVHENFRWQSPLLKLKEIVNNEKLTKPHYAKISFRHANPVGYTNQTYLYDLKEYLTLDVGIHLFDLSRFFMGEAKSIYTVNQNTNNKFKGETDFTSLIRNKNKSITIVNASISSIKKPDRFAQTLVNLEFSNGSIDLDYNYKITLHKNNKKKIYDGKPKKYKWISKPWDQIQESVINTHKHFIDSLINNIEHETSGQDNIKSLSLVFNSYKSDKLRKEIKI
ncbi:Gfo/Idh/MocA family oxidoreductase [Pelagibacteraceae bacterium]|nr:Gfo/Idh/MocA family oxidoreductase [Pelagibacteraceae bacterium]